MKKAIGLGLGLFLALANPALAGMSNPTGVYGTAGKVTCSPNFGKVNCTLPVNVQIDTSLAIGGATIGSDALAITGSISGSSTLTMGGTISTGASSALRWVSRSVLVSNADGNITFRNNGNSGFNLAQFGGITSSFPALKVNGTGLSARLADDSANTSFTAAAITATGALTLAGGTLLATSAALTNGAAAQLATITNGPVAGNPTKWVPINDNGTTRYIPTW